MTKSNKHVQIHGQRGYMINNYSLLNELNNLLQPENFQDYCPNGLQVEGNSEINKIVTGVSLNERLIDIAINQGAQAIIVHHGIFWHKEDYALTGIKKRRLEKLIKHDINLYAYHLPLDNHPDLGNNVQLAKQLDIIVHGSTDRQNLLWYGEFEGPISAGDLVNLTQGRLGRLPQLFSANPEKLIKKIAWCTGGADNFFSSAINLGVDAYISGEVSEPIMSMAIESGVDYFAAGHYATERYGIKALTEYLNQQLNLTGAYQELYNPI